MKTDVREFGWVDVRLFARVKVKACDVAFGKKKQNLKALEMW
jgi:hypothetical protein